MFRILITSLVSFAIALNPVALQAQSGNSKVLQHFQAEVDRLEGIPDWQIDYRALAKTLPAGVEPVRAWVKQETRVLPYPGLLKGAEGVFWDREGNSLDRALLLGHMLKARGETVRIGRYQINDAAKARLIANSNSSPRRFNVVAIPSTPLPLSAVDLGLKSAEWRDFASAMQDASEALPELQNAMYGALKQLVEPKLKALRSTSHEEALAASRKEAVASFNNYWVAEIKSDGAWQPLLIDDFGTVKPELQWSYSYDLSEVPELYHHSVAFDVRAVLNDGTEKSLVKLQRSASAYEGDAINISMVPFRKGDSKRRAAFETRLEQTSPSSDVHDTLKEMLDGEAPDYSDVVYWLPTISTSIGETETSGVDLNGATMASGEIERLDEDVSTRSNLRLRSVVVDIVSRFDSVIQSRERRELLAYGADGTFQRVAILSAYDVQTRRYSPAELAYRSLQQSSEITDTNPVDGIRRQNLTCLPCQTYGIMRWDIGGSSGSTFVDRPNVAGLKQYNKTGSNGSNTSTYVFDIVENSVAVLSNSSDDPFTERMRQGLRDSVAETLLMSLDSDLVVSGATASIDHHEKLKEVPISEVQNSLPGALAIAFEDLPLSNLKFVLADTKEPDTGILWWRLNPETGNLLSQGQSGEGFGIIAGAAVAFLLISVGAHAYYGCSVYNTSGEQNCGVHALKRVLLVAAGIVAGLAVGSSAFIAISLAYIGAFLWALLEALGRDLEHWLERNSEDENPPDPPAPMCVDLSSIVPRGSLGSIGTDGGICGLSCGQLTSLGSTALNACRNWGEPWCELWDDYYAREIPRCCSSGVPICR